MVGGKLLDIDPEIFRRKADYSGGMIVDTGATYTFIQEVAYAQLEAQIRSFLGGVLVEDRSVIYKDHKRLCYDGVVSRDLPRFTEVVFVCKDGALMELSIEHLFHQLTPKRFCLAVLPLESTIGASIGILGNMMQQFFYISYDLKEMALAFESLDCKSKDKYIHDEL